MKAIGYKVRLTIVNEKAGSTKRLASAMCPPLIGRYATISPNEIMTAYVIEPTILYPRSRPIGPPCFKEVAVPKNNPVPMTPPILNSRGSTTIRTTGWRCGVPNHGNVPVLELTLELMADGRGSELRLAVGGELGDADDIGLLLGLGRLVKVRHGSGSGGERRGAGED